MRKKKEDQLDYAALVATFLESYFDIPSEMFDRNRHLKAYDVQDMIRTLFREEIFESVSDMKLEAIRDYGIVLSDWMFYSVDTERK